MNFPLTEKARRTACDRRNFLLGGLATTGLAACATPTLTSPAAAPRLDPSNATDQQQLVRKMRFRLDDGPVMWWFRGENFVQQGPNLIPLYGLVFGSVMNITQRGDDGFDVVQFEMGFRTDLETGKRLTTYRNPLTNKDIEIPFVPVGPFPLSYSADNTPQLPETIGGASFHLNHHPERFYQDNGVVSFRYWSTARQSSATAKDRILNDMGIISASAAQALAPATTWADAWLSGSDVTDVPRWLEMGNVEAIGTSRMIGRKTDSFDGMPDDWKAMLEEYRPGTLEDPMSILIGSEASYIN